MTLPGDQRVSLARGHATCLQSVHQQLKTNANISHKDDEGYEEMSQAENAAEKGGLNPPPSNGLSAAQGVTSGCQDTVLARGMEEAVTYVPRV